MKFKNIEVPAKQIAIFCKKWHISKLSLFGSVLREDFRPTSDIDVLAEFESNFIPGFFKLHQIQEELSDMFGGQKIDLVTPKFLNQRIRDRVLATSEVFYDAER